MLALAAGLMAAGPALAQAPDRDAMIQELVRQIQLRDAVIQDLQRRVGSLEQRVGAPPPAAVSVPVRPEPAQAAAAPPAQAPAPQTTPQTTASAQPPADRPAAPGTVVVDEEAAERALDRTLTDVGALLLPAGRMEIAPSITYTRRESQFVRTSDLFAPGIPFAEDVRVDRDEFRAAVDVRVGLPWDTQFELGIPGSFASQKTARNLSVQIGSDVFEGRASDSSTGIGFGDVTVGLAKTLLREDGWIPDAVLRVTYSSPTGQQVQNGVIMPGTPGLHGIRSSLALTKRQDPLAFVAGFSYGHTFSGDFAGIPSFRLGDEYTLNVGAILAASPETSLQFAFQQTFQNNQKIAGVTIDDSFDSSGILSVGASMILGRGVLLSASGGVGLGRGAPDYFFALSVPVRFNTPF